MGLFGSKKEGGMMDVIRCDQKDYLIWKWSPDGQPSRKENAIRYGSSLRVKDGEVAVFVYKQKDGAMQDFIEGPFDQTIKTANFPILSGIVGAAFGGASPFQAEIYFINLAGNIQLPFYIDYFDVADSRFQDYTAPVCVKGAITFNIKDYKGFIKLHRMIDFDMEDFAEQVKRAVVRYAKAVVTNAPSQLGIPLVQIERGIDQITTLVEDKLRVALETDFGVSMKRLDLSGLVIDKESENYMELRSVTADLQSATLQAQTSIHIQNLSDQQAINAENYQETLRVQREEAQRIQRLQTESANLTAHQIDVQGAVGVTAAESLGKLGGSAGSSMGGGEGSGGGMNPAAMMTGMMMGGAVGGTMSNMMGSMMQGVNTPQPPAAPAGAMAEYHISINGSQAGPYTFDQLRQMMPAGQFGKDTHVWKAGMAGWEQAGNVQELAGVFAAVPPPPPPVPQGPPTPPPPPTEEQQ